MYVYRNDLFHYFTRPNLAISHYYRHAKLNEWQMVDIYCRPIDINWDPNGIYKYQTVVEDKNIH